MNKMSMTDFLDSEILYMVLVPNDVLSRNKVDTIIETFIADINGVPEILEDLNDNNRAMVAYMYLLYTGKFLSDVEYGSKSLFNFTNSKFRELFAESCMRGIISTDEFFRHVSLTPDLNIGVPYSFSSTPEFLFTNDIGIVILNLWYKSLFEDTIRELCHLSIFYGVRIVLECRVDYKIELLKCTDIDKRSIITDVLELEAEVTIPPSPYF